MDLLFTIYDTPQAKLVRYFTNSYWTHISGVIGDSVYDYNSSRKKIQKLGEFCDDTRPLKLDIIRNVPINEEEFLNNFEDSIYEEFGGLLRIIRKYRAGRDYENIATSNQHHTCSSLVGRHCVLSHSYSQAVPDDFHINWIKEENQALLHK